MSLLNGFQGQQPARQAGRGPQQQDPHASTLPGWPQSAQPQEQQAQPSQWPPQQHNQAPSYPPAYNSAPANPFAQGQGQDYHFPQQAAHQAAPGYGSAAADPYAPQFEPYAPAQVQPTHVQNARQQAAQYQPQQYQPQQYQPQPAQQSYAQPSHGLQQQQPGWGNAHQPQPDPRGFDIGGYGQHQPSAHVQQAGYRPQQTEPQYQEEPSLGEWSQQHNGYQAEVQEGMGYAQPAGGELDPGYGEEEIEEEEYEVEAPSRFRRPMMIAAALVGAIVVGGGVAQGYKYFLGSGAGGKPPVIKSAEGPSKVKPADAGGKQFPYSDSKIMGRLGDGTTTAAAGGAPEADVDASGSRKVATLVVGRDGSIQAPAASAAPPEPDLQAAPPPPPADTGVSVPGMTVVDAFGGQKTQAPIAAAPAAPAQKIVVSPPPPAAPTKTVAVAKVAAPVPAQTGSIEADAAPAPVVPKKIKKVTTAATTSTTAAPVSTSVATTGSGFVAVLASVPRSDSSRITALKQFADMQQKYGTVLAGKTPDVAEANLGAKGNYHRLVVGPPGSREQASSLCSQLKSQGFNDCWVTSY